MQKSIGEKVLGWFIVEETADPPVDEGAPEPKANGVTEPNAKAPLSRPSLTAVPSLADDDRDRLGRVLTLLDRLPAEATPEMKRAIVAASLDAFGVKVEAIVGSGQRALAALEAFSETTRGKTAHVTSEADARIAKLNQEIVELRRAADAERAANEDALRKAAAERARLQAALAFLQRG